MEDSAADNAYAKDLRLRDWYLKPTTETDAVYITQPTERKTVPTDPNSPTTTTFTLCDTPIHKLLKKAAQQKALEQLTAKPGKRGQFLSHLQTTNKTLTFGGLNPSRPSTEHAASIHRFKLRLSSIFTIAKLYRKGRSGSWDNNPLLQKYYKEAYKDKLCPECKLAHINNNNLPEAPFEHTMHMIDCESNERKNQLLLDTWTGIKDRLKQHPNAITANVDLLYPFTASTSTMRAALPAVAAYPAALTALRAVRSHPDAARRAALIPISLQAALEECGLSRDTAAEEAARIARDLQDALLATARMRSSRLQTLLRLKQTYRRIVRMPEVAPPSPAPPPQPPPPSSPPRPPRPSLLRDFLPQRAPATMSQ